MIPIVPIIVPPRKRKHPKNSSERAAIIMVLSSIIIFGFILVMALVGLNGFSGLTSFVASPITFIVFGLVLFLIVGVAVAATTENSDNRSVFNSADDESHYHEPGYRYRIVEKRFCNKCGASLEPDDRFCSGCGWIINR